MMHSILSFFRFISHLLHKRTYRVVVLDGDEPSFSQQMKNELIEAGFDVLSESEFARDIEVDPYYSVDAIIGEIFYFNGPKEKRGYPKLLQQYLGGPIAEIYMISQQRYKGLGSQYKGTKSDSHKS